MDQQFKEVKFVWLTYITSAGVRSCKVVPVERFKGEACEVGLCGVAFFFCTFGCAYPEDLTVSFAQEARLIPVPDTLSIHPWKPTQASCMVKMIDKEGEAWMHDGRQQMMKALSDAKSMGFEIKIGFELEFQLLKYDKDVKSEMEGDKWVTKHYTQPYCSADAFETNMDFIEVVTDYLKEMGITVELMHMEAAAAQLEIVLEYGPAMNSIDQLYNARQAIKKVAALQGHMASFLPMAHYGNEVGSGCHMHMSIWKDGVNMVPSEKDGKEQSDTCKSFMAGILESLDALTIFLAPTSNSLLRLKPEQWSGAFTCWGVENRAAPLRVPQLNKGATHSNFEVKTLDHTANTYYAVAATIQCGLDGIKRNLVLPPPAELNPMAIPEKERLARGIKPLPSTVKEAVDNLMGEKGKVIRAAMGEDFCKCMTAVRLKDAGTFKDDQMKEAAWSLLKAL